MTDRKVCPCIDCGEDVEVHKRHSLSKVRCPPHRQAHFEGAYYDCVCLLCSTEFKGRRPETKLCSHKCALKYNVQKLRGKTILRECVDCGVEIEVSWALPLDRVRCEKHRKEHRETMKERHRITRRNVKRIELGQAPYEDYIVVGPVWCSQPGSYGWRVTAKHKSNSNRREMSLVHYNLSVKLGRRVQDREGIVFLDGNVDNCDPLNLLLETEKKKEVA